MTSLLDQTALSDLADRLVAAARRAGADAADAVAVRSMSLHVGVREGAVEQSERSESDDVGLRVFVGRRTAVVSTNDIKGDVAPLAERAVAMAKVAPEDKFAGLADPALLTKVPPDLDLLDPQLPPVATLEDRAMRAEDAARAVKGVTNSEGAEASWGRSSVVLAASNGFSGGYRRSGYSLSCAVGRRRHRHGARLRMVERRPSRGPDVAGQGRPQRRQVRRPPPQSAQGAERARAGGLRPARLGRADRPSGGRHQRPRRGARHVAS